MTCPNVLEVDLRGCALLKRSVEVELLFPKVEFIWNPMMNSLDPPRRCKEWEVLKPVCRKGDLIYDRGKYIGKYLTEHTHHVDGKSSRLVIYENENGGKSTLFVGRGLSLGYYFA